MIALGAIFFHGANAMDLRSPTPNKDVALQRVGQEAILHDRRNGRAHVVNESAAQIWELCNGKNTLEQIVSAFAAEYGLSAADVQADVQDILARFHELRVLE
jgi:PqqD family protein of HPr-rel-A system